MIIKEHELEKFLNDNDQLLNILVYGPNEGLVKEQIEKIKQNYLSKEECELVNVTGKDLDNEPRMLDDVVRTISMFSKKKIVIGDTMKDKHISIIENIILNFPQQAVLIIRPSLYLSSISKSIRG